MAKKKKNKMLFEVSENGEITSYDKKNNNNNNKMLFSVGIDGKITKNNINNKTSKANYYAKSAETGLIGGLTGTASSLLTDLANNFQKGQKQNSKTIVGNIIKNALVPGGTSVVDKFNNGIDAVKKNFGDKKSKKNILQKTINTAKDIVSQDTTIDRAAQVLGNVLPKSADDKLLKANKVVSKPYNKLSVDLEKMSGKQSAGTQIVGGALQSVSNMVPSIATSLLTKNPSVGLATMGLGVKGTTTNDKLREGKTLNEAVKSGNMQGAIEVGTEMLTGGLKVFGKGTTDELVEQGIKKLAKTKLQKELLQRGYDVSGEVLEETISDVLNTAIDYGEDSNAKYTLDDWGKTAASTVISTAALNLLTGGLAGGANNISKNNTLNKYSKEQEISKQTAKNQLEEATKLNLPTADEVTSYSEDKAMKQQVQAGLLNQMANGTFENNLQNNTLSNEEVLQNELKKFKQNKSIPTKSLSNNENPADIYSSGIKNAQKNGIEINKSLKEILHAASVRGVNVTFDNNLDPNSYGVWKEIKNNDGSITRTIAFNSKDVENYNASEVFIHELFHDISPTEEGQSIINEVVKHFEENSELKDEYLKQRTILETEYAKLTNENGDLLYDPNSEEFKAKIDEEVVASVLGKKIGNKEFINQLTQEKPNLVRRIYNYIVDLLNKLKGKNTQEYKFWNNVKQNFEEAFNSEYVQSQNGSEKYSSVGIKEINKTLNRDDLTNNQKDLLNNISNKYQEALNKQNSLSNEQIRQETGWYKDPKGNWHFEITDKYAKFKFKPKENQTYKLGDLLDHKLLYDIDPTLKDVKITFKEMDTNGSFTKTPGLRKININNNLINNGSQSVKKTLIHEIQHKLQQVNGFTNGKSSGETLQDMIDYVNNLGEIEATDTSLRMNMSQRELQLNAPELSTKNPTHANKQALINKRINQLAKKKQKTYNKSKWKWRPNEENIQENISGLQGNKNGNINIDSRNGLRTSDSSFNLPKVTSNLNEYIEDVASRQAQQRIANKEAVKQSILDYLEENNITNPTKKDMMNAFGWYEENDAANEFENVRDAEKLYSEVADELLDKDNKIQGLDNHTKSDIEDMVYNHFEKAMDEYGFDVDDIQGVYLHGSRLRGNARNDSDLDAVVFYIGDENEDNIFNTINDDNNQLVVDGIKVDINPVSVDSMSEIDDYIARSEAYDNEVLKNGTKYSISNTDNQGRTLTKEQQEYFKNSIVRDENGKLKELYHGTPNDFTVFNYDFIGSNGTALGKGFYLTDNLNMAKGFSKNDKEPMKLYANITKPMSLEELTISKDEFKKFVNNIAKNDEYFLYDYGDLNREDYNKVLDYAVNLNYDGETNDVDLIHGILNTSTLGWEKGFRVLNDTLGYDGVIKHYESGIDNADGESNVYVPMFPEQIKNIDNTNPTSNKDIRYSKNVDSWDDFINNNIESEGTKTKFNKALPTKEINLPISNDNDSDKQQEVTNNIIKNKVRQTVEKESYKAVNIATKTVDKYLEFDRQRKREFKNDLSRYIGLTKDQIINAQTMNDIRDIVRKYSTKEIDYVDNEIESIKKEIRRNKIKITDNLKKQITDYNYFRKSNFNKLKLSNEGTSVDTLYQELSDTYPYYFEEKLNEADMLYALSDFMNTDATTTAEYKLDESVIEEAAVKVYNKLITNTMLQEDVDALQESLEAKYKAITREKVQQRLLEEMNITKADIANGEDISSIDIARTDPIRLNEKIFGYDVGQKINDATINKTKHNEAERTRFLNKERKDIKDLGIKARSKESAAVQKYGEKQYINKFGEVKPYGDKELAAEFKDTKTQEKIKNAAKVLRDKYDAYIDMINNSLVDMGYKPIQKRKDYMRHFQALNDVFSKFGTPLNKESMQNDSLPTDINGLTDQFKPGTPYFANALKRIGMKTEYDAITGIDGYLESASNTIYHTEDIQRYRTLSKLIRETYGTQHGFEDFANLTAEEQEARVKDIQSNKLAKYAAWLDEQANALANKKGKIDRGIEETFGRKIYTILDTAKKQVGSNMTGFNIRSAVTNFASAIQGASKTNKLAFIQGTVSTINNIVKKDSLIDKSDFLTSRFGSNSLSQKLWQKASSAGQIFMSGTDYFTANQIWRSKYFENINKGMNENAAIKDADDFAARIMGDRSKGSTATLFNSKTLGFFTQFQLEVNNQWSSLIHDNKMDIQRGNKTGAAVVFQLGQLFGLSYLFNGFMQAVTGSDVMIDPIDLLKKLFNPDDDEDKDFEQRAEEALGDIINDLPFVSFLTGGRIPISEAFSGASTLTKKLTGQKDDYGNNYAWKDVKEDIIESAFYWLLPTGYGQLKKTKQGLAMYDENLPIAGSYTDSGKLRFEADTSMLGKLQSAAFGQYASKNAKDYFDNNYLPLTEKQINTALDADLKVNEFREYNAGLKKAKKEAKENGGSQTEAVYDYIYNLPLANNQKNVLLNSALGNKDTVKDNNGYIKYVDDDNKTYWYDKKNNILYNKNHHEVSISKLSGLTKYSNEKDITDYGKYGSLAEFNYANKNPEKYSVIKQITNYDLYNVYKDYIEDISDEYSLLLDNANSKQRTAISKRKKQEIFNYINSLDLNKYQKMMLQKTAAGYSINNYKREMFNYIESLDLTAYEKQTIHNELFK